jgi:hypothetical protein
MLVARASSSPPPSLLPRFHSLLQTLFAPHAHTRTVQLLFDSRTKCPFYAAVLWMQRRRARKTLIVSRKLHIKLWSAIANLLPRYCCNSWNAHVVCKFTILTHDFPEVLF